MVISRVRRFMQRISLACRRIAYAGPSIPDYAPPAHQNAHKILLFSCYHCFRRGRHFVLYRDSCLDACLWERLLVPSYFVATICLTPSAYFTDCFVCTSPVLSRRQRLTGR